jgi:hypothetical protein
MFLADPKFKNPLASKLASDFRPFDPGIISSLHERRYLSRTHFSSSISEENKIE